jgi:hypothetical protein
MLVLPPELYALKTVSQQAFSAKNFARSFYLVGSGFAHIIASS